MRALLLPLLCLSAPAAEWFSFGLKAGVPLTAVADSGRAGYRYSGDTTFHIKRYLIGPSVEVRLPWYFRLEADALYQHARQDAFFGPAPSATFDQYGTRMSIWEIPILLKRTFGARALRPFAAAGPSLRRVKDLDVDLIRVPAPPFPGPGTRQHYQASTDEPVRWGITAGGGVSWRLRALRIEPELRYTHWTARHWMATTEQLSILLGLQFP
jgi:hypothetical protein